MFRRRSGIPSNIRGIEQFVWGLYSTPIHSSGFRFWGAGRLYDIEGNYDLMWRIAVGLGVCAAVIHWWIRERPVPRLAMAAATV